MNISLVNNSPNTRSTLRQFYLFHSWYLNCGMCMLTSVHMSCMCLILASLTGFKLGRCRDILASFHFSNLQHKKNTKHIYS